jgi:hypothetical protein
MARHGWWLTPLGLLLGGALGGGAVWRYFDVTTARQAEDRQRLTEAIALRDKLEAKLVQIADSSEKYGRIRDSVDWKNDPVARRALLTLRCQIVYLKQDVIQTEAVIAEWE